MQTWIKIPLAILTLIALALAPPVAMFAQAPHYDLLLGWPCD
jgi:hypothetical protein